MHRGRLLQSGWCHLIMTSRCRHVHPPSFDCLHIHLTGLACRIRSGTVIIECHPLPRTVLSVHEPYLLLHHRRPATTLTKTRGGHVDHIPHAQRPEAVDPVRGGTVPTALMLLLLVRICLQLLLDIGRHVRAVQHMVPLEVAYGLVDQIDLLGERHGPPGAGGVGPAEGRAAVDAAQSDLADGRGMARPVGHVGGSGGKDLDLGPNQAQRRGQPLGIFGGIAQKEEEGGRLLVVLLACCCCATDSIACIRIVLVGVLIVLILLRR